MEAIETIHLCHGTVLLTEAGRTVLRGMESVEFPVEALKWTWTFRCRHPTKRRNRKHAMRTARLRGY